MKKIIAFLLTVCLLANLLSFCIYAVPFTPGISLEEFTDGFVKIKNEYDSDYHGDIIIKDGDDFYTYEGEKIPLIDEKGKKVSAEIEKNELDIPVEIFKYNTSEKSLTKTNVTDIEEYAEKLGYNVTISNDKAIINQPFQTHRLIVKSKFKIDPLDSVAIVEGYNDLHIVQFDSLESTLKAIDFYNSQKTIEYVEPDLVMSVQATMPRYQNHLSWGSDFIGSDEFYDSFGGNTNWTQIVVGVIDSGVEYTHEFLQSRVIRTYFNTSGSGNSNDELDDHGHGTHVAGIVADATTDNVKIRSYKCLDNTGYGPLSAVVLCIEKAIQDGVNVINMSLSEEGTSSVMADTVHDAVLNGITVCVAAGNESDDAANYTPANVAECVTVGAIDPLMGTLLDYHYAEFSNYGECVDVVAPGVNIGSTWLNNQYHTLDGTSMATPFVAAAFAMFLSYDPTMTTDSMLSIMREHRRTDWRTISGRPVPNSFAVFIGGYIFNSIPNTSAPVFSVSEGTYTDNILLEITCPEEGARIYYALNDNTQNNTYVGNFSETGTLYTGPILLRQTTKVTAVAIKSNKLESNAVTATYTINKSSQNPSERYYTINDQGYITSYTGNESTIIVPDTVDGITVVGIAEGGSLSGCFFANKDSINAIYLPSSCTEIKNNAFGGCINLTNISGSGVTTVGDGVFRDCHLLVEASFPNIISVGDNSFSCCYALKNFNFNKLEAAGKSAFSNCNSITEISSSSLIFADEKAFYNMTSLTSVDFPNLGTVSTSCFELCTELRDVNLPLVSYLELRAFNCCSSLEYIYLPNLNNMEPYSSTGTSFGNTGPFASQFTDCTSLEEVYFPEYWDDVPKYCFSGCSNLHIVNLPKASALMNYSFADCNNLEIVYLPNVTSIYPNAFSSNSSNYYNLEVTVFAPKAQYISSIPQSNNVKVYCTAAATSLFFKDKDSNIIPATIYAPAGSYAQQYATDNSLTFVNTDNMVNFAGIEGFNNGLRFSYRWNEIIPQTEDVCDDVSYGFEYSVGNSSYTLTAGNNLENSNISDFNLVINNIPSAKANEQISVRATVNIDGMVFRSAVIECTYNQYKPILVDINNDSSVNDDDLDLLLDISVGIIETGTLTQQQLDLADLNNDGVIDGFDAALFEKYSYNTSYHSKPEDNMVLLSA